LKRCSDCQNMKNENDFFRYGKFYKTCNTCSLRQKKKRLNPKNQAKYKEWCQKNRKRINLTKKRFYQRNAKKISEYRKVRNQKLKFSLMQKYGFFCKKCKSQNDLCLHHINWNDEDNRPENLIILCRSCHRKVHAFIPLSENLKTKWFKQWLET